MTRRSDPGGTARTANLLGALALEAALAQDTAGRRIVGQAGAAAAALDLIAALPGSTIERLRKPLGLTQPGTTRLVDRLVDAGWVVRDGGRGRGGLRLHLTDAGQRVLAELLEARRQTLTELIEVLDPAERGQLAHLAGKMLAARTTDRSALDRLCRLCERPACSQCPVGATMDELLSQAPESAQS